MLFNFYNLKCEKLLWNTGVKEDCVALSMKIWKLMIVIRLVSKVHDQKVSWSLAIFSSAIIMKGIIFMTLFTIDQDLKILFWKSYGSIKKEFN